MAPGGGPVCGGVTTGALGCGEAGDHVVGHGASHSCRAVVLVRVASVAIGVGRCEIVVVVRMARGARGCRMYAGERPTCHGMVEGVIRPGNRIVASRAVRRGERGARGRVRRIVCLLPSDKVAARVAAVAGLDGQIVISTDVALRAGGHLSSRCHLVRVGEWKTRRAVIELPVCPCRDRMAA